MSSNIITAAFANSDIAYTKPAYQYDYGMILKFSGIELPQAYEVHFSNTEFCGESISQIGDETGVTIPDEMFLSGNPIYAWTYLHTGLDDGETVYKAVISVNKRAKPSDLEPTPVQHDAITQAIAALNVAVEQTAADVVAAGESAEAAAGSAETAGQAKDDAVEAKDKAVEAKNAAETAQGKAEDAQRAAEQAAGSVLGLTADATVDANVGTPSVEVDVTTESDHKNMSFSFHNLKGVQGDPGDAGVGISSVVLNADYTLTITLTNGVSYTTSSIRGEVGATPNLTIGTVSTLPEGSQATATITGTDEDPVLNLGIPVGDTGDPGISPTITVTEITGGHEVEVTDAEGTQTFDVMDGEVSEEQLETALIDKADVITSSASGEIVTISDGGNDLPVVDLKLSLLPVQDLHGQDAPYPAGGGKNKVAPVAYTGAAYNMSVGAELNLSTATIQPTVSGNTIVYSDTAWNGYSFKTAPLKAGTYNVHADVTDTTDRRLSFYVVGSNNVIKARTASYNTNVENRSYTIEDDDYIVFYCTVNVTRTITIKDLQIESGSSFTSFAPYSNICSISGWTGVEVHGTGKNLLAGTSTEIGAYTDADFGINTSLNTYTSQKVYLKKGSYVLSSATASATIVRRILNGTYSAATRNMPMTFTVSEDGWFGFSSDASNFQIELGSSETAYDSQGAIYPISWQTEAGTVYGGSLDVTTGVLTDEMGVLTLDSNIPSGTGGFRNLAVLSEGVRCEYYPYRAIGQGNSARVYSDRFANRDASTGTPYSIITNIGDPRLLVCLPLEYDTVDKFISYFTANPLDIYYYKQTPTTYQLTPTQVSTFLGVNNFWSNSNGQIDLEYRCDTKLYIEQLTKPTEDDMVANANIASGKFFMVGNRLMLSTTAIAQGEQIVVGTNCSEVSFADALNQINA